MDTAGNRPEPPARPRPLIEDLPLSGWEPQVEQRRPVPPPRRPARRGLPVVVALLLVAGLLFVTNSADDGHGDASGEVPGSARPAAGPEPVPSAARNPLLVADVPLPPVTCELPAMGRDLARLRALYLAQIGCLERAWAPALERAGHPFGPVRVQLADHPRTACGALPPADEATGFYCGDDHTIYLPRQRVLAALGADPPAHIATLAHEYGHHVQQLSGILARAGQKLAAHEPGSAGDREVGRRVELQANCFAGMFLASVAGRGTVSATQAQDAVDDFRNWVDSRTHGSSDTQLYWARAGFDGTGTAACNTWVAALDQVS
ncbi:neutral zinc metallopeptidase [Qaidamihabitans albus]|uniref:neutral zinc metallopeptidase n=1 Tax=Qaidamihabitans albus TaxID=2795733 RepID=UPI0027DC3E1C|nr:neutral zinc metallopeptidase [Qaidamihabitans albus]